MILLFSCWTSTNMQICQVKSKGTKHAESLAIPTYFSSRNLHQWRQRPRSPMLQSDWSDILLSKNSFFTVQVPGIEPGPPAWQVNVLTTRLSDRDEISDPKYSNLYQNCNFLQTYAKYCKIFQIDYYFPICIANLCT